MTFTICCLCHDSLSGKEPIGAFNCGHCLHEKCQHELLQWNQQNRPGTQQECPMCKTTVTAFTPLDFNIDNSAVESFENKESEQAKQSICVEDAGVYFVNGTYYEDHMDYIILKYVKLGSYCEADSVYIHKKLDSDKIICWFMTVVHEEQKLGYWSNADYYAAPVNMWVQFLQLKQLNLQLSIMSWSEIRNH